MTTYGNSIVALCDGASTLLSAQPPRPSHSVLRARRRVLFGVQLPPSSAGNTLLDLYSSDGTRITLRSLADLQRVAGNPAGLPLDFPAEISYPQTIELSAPWGLGAPGQQRDVHFAIALLVQLSATPSTSRVDPGPNDLRACDFTRLCRRETPDYNTTFANDRALREMCTIPIFQHPKVFMIPVKHEVPDGHGGVAQAWFPWQVCTNCLAGRAKGRCSLRVDALRVQTPLRVLSLLPGQTSEDDLAYGWFTSVRDAFLDKDLGYYDLWVCRDGAPRTIASHNHPAAHEPPLLTSYVG